MKADGSNPRTTMSVEAIHNRGMESAEGEISHPNIYKKKERWANKRGPLKWRGDL